MPTDSSFPLDHNRPDITADIISRLEKDYEGQAEAVQQLALDALSLPPSVETKEDHDKYVDLIANLKDKGKTLETLRVAEKNPYLLSERAVDGFFNRLLEPLEKTTRALTKAVTAFLIRKAEEKRQEEIRAANEARQRAEEARREEEKRRLAMAEAQRKDHAASHAARAEEAASEARMAETESAEHEQAAQAAPAELARTRSETGTLSTLKAEWSFTIVDADAIDLGKLRPYIPAKVIESAVRTFVRMGGRELAGVKIFEAPKGMIR